MVEQTQVEQKYIDYWRSRQAKRVAQEKVWEEAAWAEVEKVARLLKSQFGVTKVIVFGSLVSDRFGEDSDIDIAAEGMADADFFEALAAVNAKSDRWIDLKPIESLDARFRDRVFETGRVVDANS
ncbi:MAG: nucleotidyltransferase domain-containing protein [Phormidesmis sp.]